MRFDISRDFLDGILLQHPPRSGFKGEIQANAGINALPSSPDGTMHTVVINFQLQAQGMEQPFVRGAWRFLFTSDEHFDLRKEIESNGTNQPFLHQVMSLGCQKIIAVLNPMCLLANLPLLPSIDFQQRPTPPTAATAGTEPTQTV